MSSQQAHTSGKVPKLPDHSMYFSYCSSRKKAIGTPNVTSSTQRSCRVVMGQRVQSEKPIAPTTSVLTRCAT
jgi:hypothetical protein